MRGLVIAIQYSNIVTLVTRSLDESLGQSLGKIVRKSMGSDPMRDSFLALQDSFRDSGRDWFPTLFFSARASCLRIPRGRYLFLSCVYSIFLFSGMYTCTLLWSLDMHTLGRHRGNSDCDGSVSSNLEWNSFLSISHSSLLLTSPFQIFHFHYEKSISLEMVPWLYFKCRFYCSSNLILLLVSYFYWFLFNFTLSFFYVKNIQIWVIIY